MWVADDGSYGSGEVEEFDTSNWTEDDLRAVDDASDSSRLHVAKLINNQRNTKLERNTNG